MEKTVQKIPFLRLVAGLSLGIITGHLLSVSTTVILLTIVLTLSTLIYINKIYHYRFEIVFGMSVHLLFLLLGILIFNEYNQKPIFTEGGKFKATVMEAPQEKQNSYKALIKITAFKGAGIFCRSHENVLAYFAKNKKVELLNPGDVIIIKSNPQFIRNRGNPFEFDYKKYLARRRIYRQVYLTNASWAKTDSKAPFSLRLKAEQTREKLLTIYRSQPLGKKELEILSALTLGYKRELDPETKHVFSNTGAMHVLAVSGLHVGILLWFFSLLFGFLRRWKSGKTLFVILSLLFLWSYVFITGLPPSVERAATMFSIFVVGNNLRRQANIYNSLAASAFFILLLNPNNLFEVGFQLSYAAVFGIVFLQPRLEKLLIVDNKIFRFFWRLFTVSVTAQIATFPITIYYFSQFPAYFWITNLFIIPAVMALIILGIALLIVAPIPLIPEIISTTINMLIHSILNFLSAIQKLPFSVEKFAITPLQLFLLFGVLLAGFLFIDKKEIFYLKVVLTCLFLVFISSLFQQIVGLYRREIIIYNNPGNTTVQLISGKENFILSEKAFNKNDYFREVLEKTQLKYHLRNAKFYSPYDTINEHKLCGRQGVFFFEGKSILFEPKQKNPVKIKPDFLVNPLTPTPERYNLQSNTLIITNKNNFSDKSVNSNRIYAVVNQGAFQKKW
ncbi:MAG: ComEC/Rec2 family competence protein [Prolixibacteraceae bacterium]|nr:ComEC/Rec2 family competence protein [Prolixibacteraceae bacterium]